MHANFMSQDDRTISGSHTHTHTHTHPFNGPFSGTTWVGRYQKGKPIWILLKQESVSGSGISWARCKSAPRSRQINMLAPHHPTTQFFTGWMPFLLPNQQRQSTEGKISGSLNMQNLKYCIVVQVAVALVR